MTKIIYVYATHRSRSLAERHARELKLHYSALRVRIVARRNKRGMFSANGREFTFEVTLKAEKNEYVLHFDYGSKKGKNLIRFQLHIIGPADASDDEAIAVGIALDLGIQEVEGWKFRLITWGHPPSPITNPWDKDDLVIATLYETAVERGYQKVAWKNSIRKNRSITK